MTDPIVIDNTLLYVAATALERELAVVVDHATEETERIAVLMESVQLLRAVANAANGGEPIGLRRTGDDVPWPGVRIIVQGVMTDDTHRTGNPRHGIVARSAPPTSEGAPAGAPAKATVHILKAGVTLCGRVWPDDVDDGDRWVPYYDTDTKASEEICAACRLHEAESVE